MRIDALQIPEAILLTISTEGLLETCLSFPYLLDILYFNNYQQGFEALTAEFNGFRELLKRPDLTQIVIEKYKRQSSYVVSVRSKSIIDQGMFSFRHFVLEFILAQDIILDNLLMKSKKMFYLG